MTAVGKIKHSAVPELLSRVEEKMSQVILGKDNEIKLTLCCLLAQGHILIEDLPGMGKTTMVKAIGRLLGLDFVRVQFTNDLLPADILGGSVFDQSSAQFKFHKGPIFAQMVLADEINRATPKTQSACLQAMEEFQVTIDGKTHQLPKPFFLIATQNPKQNIGTFPLPESQLDRFLMKINLGFPGREAEKLLLMGESRHSLIEDIEPAMEVDQLLEMQDAVRSIHASENVVTYLQDLVEHTRVHFQGLSPRAALGVLRAAQAWAYLGGRDFVVPEDVQAVAVATMNHRLSTTEDPHGLNGRQRVRDMLSKVDVS